MNNDTQIMKGILEGCLLRIMETGELYGYAAVETLNRLGFDVNEATVYPILSRLQNKGLLQADKRPSPYGPMRKYYSLTDDGAHCLHTFRQTWKKISGIVNVILEDDLND